MPIITPRNVAMSDGKFQASVYRGSADDRAEFGVTAKALVDQNNDWEHWIGAQRVRIGDKFRRRVSNWNGTDWAIKESWTLCPIEEWVAKQPTRFNPDVQASTAAGQPMIDPVGLPIFQDPDGNGKSPTQPAMPAQGEPARDPWTGALTGETQP